MIRGVKDPLAFARRLVLSRTRVLGAAPARTLEVARARMLGLARARMSVLAGARDVETSLGAVVAIGTSLDVGFRLDVTLVSAQAWAIDPEPPFEDPQLEAEYQALIKEVRCLVCQNQTIADSMRLWPRTCAARSAK